MIVVDSSVWINQIRGRETEATRALESIQDTTAIIVGDVVLLEVLQGARSEPTARLLEGHLRRFQLEPMLDSRLAIQAADNYRRLRKAGVTIRSSIDMIIATFCIEKGHALLEDDRDFRPMAEHLGLRLA